MHVNMYVRVHVYICMCVRIHVSLGLGDSHVTIIHIILNAKGPANAYTLLTYVLNI